MTQHSNDRPSPAVLLISETSLPSPLAKLADIPEEEIWLAKQKGKRTPRLQAQCSAFHEDADDPQL